MHTCINSYKWGLTSLYHAAIFHIYLVTDDGFWILSLRPTGNVSAWTAQDLLSNPLGGLFFNWWMLHVSRTQCTVFWCITQHVNTPPLDAKWWSVSYLGAMFVWGALFSFAPLTPNTKGQHICILFMVHLAPSVLNLKASAPLRRK